MSGTAASASSRHWPEYLMEAALLGLFMISACAFTVLLEFPGSPVRQAVPDPGIRRFLTGLAMGTTAIALIYSPWGKQSGAHFNPAMTLTFSGGSARCVRKTRPGISSPVCRGRDGSDDRARVPGRSPCRSCYALCCNGARVAGPGSPSSPKRLSPSC